MLRQNRMSFVWSLVLLVTLGFAAKPAAATTQDPIGAEIGDDDDGFDDWGLLGLLGLLGLMGRRTVRRDPVDTSRRV